MKVVKEFHGDPAKKCDGCGVLEGGLYHFDGLTSQKELCAICMIDKIVDGNMEVDVFGEMGR